MKSTARVQPARSSTLLTRNRRAQPVLLSRESALKDIACRIGACMEQLSAAGYHETAAMLAIAQLDLRARLYGVTEDELQYIATKTQD